MTLLIEKLVIAGLIRKIENKNFSGEQFDQGMIRAVWHIARVVIYSPMY